ncbi:MAG: hypothetical protein JWN85_1390 [Gammaproteobacteria bacterium]|nr:hypothetical protein [Gammaproteobacteria bacterium]
MWRAAARHMWWHTVHLVATEAFEPESFARPTWDLRVAPAPSHTPERRGAHPARRRRGYGEASRYDAGSVHADAP